MPTRKLTRDQTSVRDVHKSSFLIVRVATFSCITSTELATVWPDIAEGDHRQLGYLTQTAAG